MQTIKKNWVYLLFLVAAILAATRFCSRETEKEGVMHLSMRTFPVNNGWGYELLTNDSVYIRQEFIPAITGKKAFATKEDAEKTAGLALRKLHTTRFPMITLKELDSLGVTL